MNFRAHLALSHESDDAMLGAVLADFIKGRKALDALTPDLRRAVLLHRRVDWLADEHAAARRSVARFAPRWGLLSSVVVDMLYDHLLARDWHRHRPEPLAEFASNCYRSFERQRHRMPDDMRHFADRMIEYDFLGSYASAAGIRTALDRLSRWIRHRTKREVYLGPAVEDLYAAHDAYAADFAEFWPAAVAFADSERARLAAEAG